VLGDNFTKDSFAFTECALQVDGGGLDALGAREEQAVELDKHKCALT